MIKPEGSNVVSDCESTPAATTARTLLHRRLAAYALAAGAASISVAAMAAPTEAAQGSIVFTPTHAFLGGLGTTFLNLDLNHDGITDFAIAVYNFRTSVPSSAFAAAGGSFWDNPAAGNGSLLHPMKKGAVIGGSGVFYTGRDRLAWGNSVNHSGHGGYYTGGPWADNVPDQYLGVRFLINGQTHYGWVRMSITAYPYEVYATVTGYAYNTVPNQSLRAGQGAFPSQEATDRPASLGALSLGARGLDLWRKKAE